MRHGLWGLMMLSLLGCRDEVDPGSDADTGGVFSPELIFTVAEGAVYAGNSVSYLAWVDGMGQALEVEVELSSSLESELQQEAGQLTPTVAGTHVLTASADLEGYAFSKELELVVAPGAPASLDLSLSDLGVAAGDPILFEISSYDLWDNPRDVSGLQLKLSDEASVSVVDDRLVSTVVGRYEASVSGWGFEDREAFQIFAGPPASLTLDLPDADVELYETVVAEVELVDYYGNPVSDDWTLEVAPSAGVEVYSSVVTFLSEGRFTLTATSSDGSLSDSFGPLVVDSTGPDPGIIEPDRGLKTTDAELYIQGVALEEYSGLESLTVQGQDATIYEDDSWESWVDLVWGTNRIETVAVDGDGNVTSDLRTALHGSFRERGAQVDDGIMVRVGEGGFDTLSSLVVDLVGVDSLLDSIPETLIDESSESCWDLFGWEECITWYAFSMGITDFYIDDILVSIDPTSGGYLDTIFSIEDLSFGLYADGVILGIGFGTSGEISTDSVNMVLQLYPTVSGGSLAVYLGNTDIELVGFELDNGFYDVIEAALDFFGLDINSYLADLIEGLVEDLALDQIPDLVNELLQDLEIAVDLDLLESVYSLDALFSTAAVDDLGLTLGLSTWFEPSAWSSEHEDTPGSLYADYNPPDYGGSDNPDGMELAMNLDFLNQVLHAMWGGGLLDMSLDGAELGLDLSDFGDFLPGLESLSVGTRALQPPVALPGTGEDILDFQLGDLEFSLYSGAVDEANLWMRMYVSLEGGLSVGFSEDAISAGLGELDVAFDLVYPNDRVSYAADAELFLETLLPLLLPTLTDALSEIPLPAIQGFSLGDISLDLGGDVGGFLQIEGNLVIVEE